MPHFEELNQLDASNTRCFGGGRGREGVEEVGGRSQDAQVEPDWNGFQRESESKTFRPTFSALSRGKGKKTLTRVSGETYSCGLTLQSVKSST